MKKVLSVILSVAMLLTMMSFGAAAEGTFTPGTYTGSGDGYGAMTGGSKIAVTVTVDENAITAIEIAGENETPGLGSVAIDLLKEALVGVSSADDIDTLTAATAKITVAGIKEAVAEALAAARGEAVEAGEIAFVPGTYEGTAAGYNGNVTVSVTFTADAIESIEVTASKETAHVGTPAYDILIPEIIEYTSTGVDTVSGATFTSVGLLNAVNDAAEKAGCSAAALKAGKKAFEVSASDPIEVTYDMVIVGAGGAGIAAAAQAVQDGNTVLIIEKNAEVGGNTLVSGGQYQSVMPYLVWDVNDPDATTGVYEHNGQTYNKVTNTAKGNLDTLRTILNWSEEAFDEHYFDTIEYVAGEIDELSKAGVHAEYLPVLQALKAEIAPYLEWADAKIAAGAAEQELTLFSTVNLHIFQSYYGGLRQNADHTAWIYGDVDLVSQFVEQGQGLKEWLEDQGSVFNESLQLTLIGALWYRENVQVGADLDGDGNLEASGNWGAYFLAPMNTVTTVDGNEIMLRTTANELIYEDGRVTGVKATRYDGTEVTAHATKGVILATGGYAANIDMVLNSNEYWSSEYVTTATKTTNRNSLQGDGITMAAAIGADTTGMEYTQMMPISWIDNGNLAFGSGAFCIYINPTTGHRFVNETSERDVLSLAEFNNGVVHNGTPGVFIEISNAGTVITPYAYKNADGSMVNDDVSWRQYVRTVDQLDELFDELGFECDAATVKATIEAYDAAFLSEDGSVQYPDVYKTGATNILGKIDENGNYTLDGVELRIRLMAPSTHHTMGGLKVDLDRHVLDTDGNAIPGLYAAGEVTGGIHGGNRLGGNAIVEIFVSGRIAAQTANAGN